MPSATKPPIVANLPAHHLLMRSLKEEYRRARDAGDEEKERDLCYARLFWKLNTLKLIHSADVLPGTFVKPLQREITEWIGKLRLDLREKGPNKNYISDLILSLESLWKGV